MLFAEYATFPSLIDLGTNPKPHFSQCQFGWTAQLRAVVGPYACWPARQNVGWFISFYPPHQDLLTKFLALSLLLTVPLTPRCNYTPLPGPLSLLTHPTNSGEC